MRALALTVSLLLLFIITGASGKALKLAENGDVDVVLSHAPELEEAS